MGQLKVTLPLFEGTAKERRLYRKLRSHGVDWNRAWKLIQERVSKKGSAWVNSLSS